MREDYVAPRYNVDAFNCPWCNAYAQQDWYELMFEPREGAVLEVVEGTEISICKRCSRYALWVEERMVYPAASTAPLPAEDMPQGVKVGFEDARNIVNASPRAASALLRLALEKLITVELDVKGKDLNDAIRKLVQQGLPEQVQKALDAVRVIGNEAIHPGQIDLSDDVETATALFDLLNWITDDLITKPRKIDEIYESLPQSKKEAIEKRDSVQNDD